MFNLQSSTPKKKRKEGVVIFNSDANLNESFLNRFRVEDAETERALEVGD